MVKGASKWEMSQRLRERATNLSMPEGRIGLLQSRHGIRNLG